jgi:hypothetical protein
MPKNVVTEVANSSPSQAPGWRTGFRVIAEELIFRHHVCLGFGNLQASYSIKIGSPLPEVE